MVSNSPPPVHMWTPSLERSFSVPFSETQTNKLGKELTGAEEGKALDHTTQLVQSV